MSLLPLLGLPSNQSTQMVVCTVVDVEWNDDPNPIQEHKHKPEILELQVRIKFRRPVLGEGLSWSHSTGTLHTYPPLHSPSFPPTNSSSCIYYHCLHFSCIPALTYANTYLHPPSLSPRPPGAQSHRSILFPSRRMSPTAEMHCTGEPRNVWTSDLSLRYGTWGPWGGRGG